ncbi:IS4 family transposase [Rhizobium ruizarguesonis]|uniref:IS4 family transposase n=1 Tax=Rhizobium ruizarguesonis TaxID=2081791 RepID=UPI00103207BC|nr:IS4 family transposase [Rhizobium ruizarguesonis]NEI07950.1 IS4 family transposase [Rhizobium ruizarguesonis]NEI29595.1 IS4 family transposase [Rhizobium ruizarguesonis]TAY92678.1 IS4 family transposase [Rhizobium ruizarguesonis]TAZ77452.1 IS4 family transposase [Rhizobium ruizarguesonis]TBA03827.1 IS4 family transposase [Rhizobium ruizarguesonis]
MQHKNSVFHDLLKRIPWSVFDRLVDEHGADKHVRRLSTKDQFIALLYGQLAGAVSLREIAGGLESHTARLYHLGARPVSRSTLADANAKRSSAVFAGLFAELAAKAGRGLRRAMGEATYLIDATSVRLSGAGSQWARFSHQACGAKVHIVYDADNDRPIYAAVTPANVNDITAAKAMPIEPGATYVFDLGYYDFGWWAKMDKAGCRIVTRFKSHTPLAVTREQAVEDAGPILSDRIGLLPARQAKSRRNPFSDPVREVTVRTDTGKVLRILSNDLEAPAQEIADLYKRRWAIELFFRWVKQTLKIRHFPGNSENAVRIQIAVALIAFLLLRIAQADQKMIQSPLAFARLVRANLMHRRRTDTLLKPPPDETFTQQQLMLKWT